MQQDNESVENTLVINGDGRNIDLLKESGIVIWMHFLQLPEVRRQTSLPA
jgi:hypothetical protein